MMLCEVCEKAQLELVNPTDRPDIVARLERIGWTGHVDIWECPACQEVFVSPNGPMLSMEAEG